MKNGGANNQSDLRTSNMQDANPSSLTRGMLRSKFARALHFAGKPQKDDLHKQELEALDRQLNAFVSGETREEIEGQLDGQRILVKRLKGNLKDNRTKLRSVLKDLKASRKKLVTLEDHINKQRKEMFEKSMTIDTQRIEIDYLRNELERVEQQSQNNSAAPDVIASLTIENNNLKNQLSDLRHNNQTRDTLSPKAQETLKILNAEIEALKNTEAENKAEIAFLKTENEASQKRQAELMAELIVLRKAAKSHKLATPGPIDTTQIQALSEKLHHSAARESMMEKRLDILRRDLDIVNQTNDMLRGRIAELEAAEIAFPNQAVGF